MVSKLKRTEKLVPCAVISYTTLDNALNDLRHSGKIGNWPVVWKISLPRESFLRREGMIWNA